MVALVRVLKALVVSLLLAASAYAVSKINLFGLENASDRLADGVYQRITAADYGPDRKGQKAVSLVYLDETSVEAMKGYGWTRFPPTYDQQWTMIDDVLNAGGAPPAAVFVDFVYMGQGGPTDGFDAFLAGIAAATRAQAWADRPACTADPLMKIACIVAAGGVPIVVAKPSPADLDLFTDVQRKLDGVSVMAPALVGQQAYPTITVYGFDAAKAARLSVHRFDVSPAFALYAAYCLRRADACGIAGFKALQAAGRSALAGGTTRAPDLAKTFDAPLDVVWGSRPDPDYLRMTEAVSGRKAPCRADADGWRGRLMEQMAGLRGPAAGARQECAYTLSLGYDRMVGGQGLESRDLQRLLAGRLVMVGGQFHASSDWVESPVHGQVPGVQYHAMALDNLIEDGADYRRNANAMVDSDFLKSLLIFALAFCGVMGVMARNTLLDRAIEEGVEPRLRSAVYGPLYLLMFTTSLGVIGFATWLGVAYAHRSPINWIGLSSVALGFLFYATRQTLPADISGSIERIPVVRRILAYIRLCSRALKFEEDRLARPRPPAPAPAPPAATPAPVTPASSETVHVQV
ncbi:CHASE2 domain-containing protein [Phenylobacterium sp.]|uniref:CHASE2 domain-containing protein n=1 Tax=Phenylobacterium sp. TaxID=1871053 RepID=UPI0035630CF0